MFQYTVVIHRHCGQYITFDLTQSWHFHLSGVCFLDFRKYKGFSQADLSYNDKRIPFCCKWLIRRYLHITLFGEKKFSLKVGINLKVPHRNHRIIPPKFECLTKVDSWKHSLPSLRVFYLTLDQRKYCQKKKEPLKKMAHTEILFIIFLLI